ncbi:hypothetical protein [Labrenzia sp. 011]|uniref:hypothetical protein n=1 Tax=Labrenzia sp. 011 TaxID=2171494 RepID=UPI001057556C|nr:hypothetical protein [Labrenzia sp. 011]
MSRQFHRNIKQLKIPINQALDIYQDANCYLNATEATASGILWREIRRLALPANISIGTGFHDRSEPPGNNCLQFGKRLCRHPFRKAGFAEFRTALDPVDASATIRDPVSGAIEARFSIRPSP